MTRPNPQNARSGDRIRLRAAQLALLVAFASPAAADTVTPFQVSFSESDSHGSSGTTTIVRDGAGRAYARDSRKRAKGRIHLPIEAANFLANEIVADEKVFEKWPASLALKINECRGVLEMKVRFAERVRLYRVCATGGSPDPRAEKIRQWSSFATRTVRDAAQP